MSSATAEVTSPVIQNGQNSSYSLTPTDYSPSTDATEGQKKRNVTVYKSDGDSKTNEYLFPDYEVIRDKPSIFTIHKRGFKRPKIVPAKQNILIIDSSDIKQTNETQNKSTIMFVKQSHTYLTFSHSDCRSLTSIQIVNTIEIAIRITIDSIRNTSLIKPRKAVSDLFKFINRELNISNFSNCDTSLKFLNVELDRPELLIGALSATLPVKDKLNNRSCFYDSIGQEFLKKYPQHKVISMLKGLE